MLRGFQSIMCTPGRRVAHVGWGGGCTWPCPVTKHNMPRRGLGQEERDNAAPADHQVGPPPLHANARARQDPDPEPHLASASHAMPKRSLATALQGASDIVHARRALEAVAPVPAQPRPVGARDRPRKQRRRGQRGKQPGGLAARPRAERSEDRLTERLPAVVPPPRNMWEHTVATLGFCAHASGTVLRLTILPLRPAAHQVFGAAPERHTTK